MEDASLTNHSPDKTPTSSAREPLLVAALAGWATTLRLVLLEVVAMVPVLGAIFCSCRR